MKKESLKLIHQSYNNFFDIEDNSFYDFFRRRKFTALEKSFISLSNKVKDEDVKIVSMFEYKILIWRTFNKLIKFKDLLLYEPSNDNFDEEFYSDKYIQIKKFKLNLIKHIN